MNPGINRCVFLEEVSTEGLSTNDVGVLRDKVYGIMEAKLLEYGASWIKNPVKQKTTEIS